MEFKRSCIRECINKLDFDKSRIHVISSRVTTKSIEGCITSELMCVKGMSGMIKKQKQKFKILTNGNKRDMM